MNPKFLRLEFTQTFSSYKNMQFYLETYYLAVI